MWRRSLKVLGSQLGGTGLSLHLATLSVWPQSPCVPPLPSPEAFRPTNSLLSTVSHFLAGKLWISHFHPGSVSFFICTRGRVPPASRTMVKLSHGTTSESPSCLHRAMPCKGWASAPGFSSHGSWLSQSLGMLRCPAPSSRDSTLSLFFPRDALGHVLGFTHHCSVHTDANKDSDSHSCD